MQKTITYLYPDCTKVSNLKIFQDRTNQIKAFYFTRENIKEVENIESSQNYAVYFLFDDSEGDINKVYVGQSINGFVRILEHVRNKDFWTYCIMFVTDNNSFDKLTIDYIEYVFIKKFKKSNYILINRDLRLNEPNISIYDKPNILTCIKQIEFLLNAEGVVFNDNDRNITTKKYYYPKSEKYNAKIYVEDGKFVLVKGSEIKRPPEYCREWKTNNHYFRNNKLIDDYINDEKFKVINGSIVTQINLKFKSPSFVASLISGLVQNGWDFFEDLNELRKINNFS